MYLCTFKKCYQNTVFLIIKKFSVDHIEISGGPAEVLVDWGHRTTLISSPVIYFQYIQGFPGCVRTLHTGDVMYEDLPERCVTSFVRRHYLVGVHNLARLGE